MNSICWKSWQGLNFILLSPPLSPIFPQVTFSLLLINPYSCFEADIFYFPLYCSKTVVIKILESWKLNRGVLNLKHQMWKASTAIYITFQNRQKKLMSYSTNTVHDVSFQSLNYQNLMLFIFPCLIVLLECTCFWKISAPSTLCSLVEKNYIFVFSSPEVLQGFFFNFIWHFIIYYIPCLHVHAPWHYAALMWRLGTHDRTGLQGLASMHLRRISQQISGTYYIWKNC